MGLSLFFWQGDRGLISISEASVNLDQAELTQR